MSDSPDLLEKSTNSGIAAMIEVNVSRFFEVEVGIVGAEVVLIIPAPLKRIDWTMMLLPLGSARRCSSNSLDYSS